MFTTSFVGPLQKSVQLGLGINAEYNSTHENGLFRSIFRYIFRNITEIRNRIAFHFCICHIRIAFRSVSKKCAKWFDTSVHLTEMNNRMVISWKSYEILNGRGIFRVANSIDYTAESQLLKFHITIYFTEQCYVILCIWELNSKVWFFSLWCQFFCILLLARVSKGS